ncbi:MAG: DNA-processing protein DprA [Dehalococcoidales bacterium]|nr:DNA-processing protein DprA [Dehalococcoidales bacterium]
MINTVSSNTQAVLLLTAPLITGSRTPASETLTLSEYNRLAALLVENSREPGDLLGIESDEILDLLEGTFDVHRMKTLLERGVLLTRAIETWQARSIWVISRADSEYPERLKSRLKSTAPPLLYGCGDSSLMEMGGLAVVGSRDVSEHLIDYTKNVTGLVAEAGYPVISGGARGIDQSAMAGALHKEGKVTGIMADSLNRAVISRDLREYLMNNQLLLVSPFDPSAGFHVGNAMQRNKYIYSLADAALVVSSDFQRGGTWAGASEQLDKFHSVPVYVRPHTDNEKGLKGLIAKGARIWPEPSSPEEFTEIINREVPDTNFPALQGKLNL